ncbi:hypothetical protein ACTHQ4_20085 [Alkalicoccobacillus gibsonii]|uniref:hypothetical protein n=1 Tax=Alkalicoccobacillus gibsonii TaxID=79881 RepID=UPI003F7B81C2
MYNGLYGGFEDFLREQGWPVKTEMHREGQLYEVNGERFFYKDVDRSSFSDLHKTYLKRNSKMIRL